MTGLGLGLGLSHYKRGGGGIPLLTAGVPGVYTGTDPMLIELSEAIPLRTVSVQNRPNKETYSNADADRYGARVGFKVAVDSESLVLNWNNFRLSQTRPMAANNQVTISGVTIEINESAVPVYFSGGRSIDLDVRDTDKNSDEVPASAFGLETIPAGTIAFVRYVVRPPALGQHVLFGGSNYAVSEYAGQQSIRWNSGNTTVDESDYAGQFLTVSGAMPTTSTALWQLPMLLGRPVADGPSFIAVGTSIADAVGDSSQGVTGKGFVQRAMALGTELPCINMARSGSLFQQLDYENETDLMMPYAKYCRFLIDEMGTNDISTNESATVEYMTEKVLRYYAAFRAEGIEKIIRTKLMVKTSSSDNWTSSAQTIAAEWGAGERKDQLNDWFDNFALETGIVDYVVQMDGIRDISNNSIWAFDGTSKRYTTDGTHPSPYAHEVLAEGLRATIDTLISQTSNPHSFVYQSTVLKTGELVMYKFDPTTKELVDSFELFEGYGLNDDHNTGFFVQEADGNFFCGAAGHGDSVNIHYRRAATWDDLKAQATQTISVPSGNVTYPNAYVMGNKTVVVVRGGGTTEWSMFVSEDGGAFDPAIVIVKDETQTYVHPVVLNENVLRLFLNRNSNVTSSRVRIVDLYINAADGFAAGDMVTGNAVDAVSGNVGTPTLVYNIYTGDGTGVPHEACTIVAGPLGPDLYIAPYDWSPDGKQIAMASFGNTRSLYYHVQLRDGGLPYLNSDWVKSPTSGIGALAETGEGAGRWIGRTYISRESGLFYPRHYESRYLNGKWELVLKDAINKNGGQFLETIMTSKAGTETDVLFRPYPCRNTQGGIPFSVLDGEYVEYYANDTLIKFLKNPLPAQQQFEFYDLPLAWRFKAYGTNASDMTLTNDTEILEYNEITGNYPRMTGLSALRAEVGGSINGNASITFDGAQIFRTAYVPKETGHFVALLKQNSKSGTQTIAGVSDSGSARVRFELVATTGQLRAIIGATTHTFTFTDLPSVGTPFVAGLSWDGTTVTAYLNDKTQTQTQAGTAVTTRPFWLGALNNANSPANYAIIEMADAIFADEVLTGTDWTDIRDYLMTQGGLLVNT